MLAQFPQCRALIPGLRPRAAASSVEATLETYLDEAKKRPERHQQLAAIRFYLSVMIWHCQRSWESFAGHITNYRVLLDRIALHRASYEKVCFVTFNYDTMLEHAFSELGIQITSMSDYVASDTYKLIQVHGSINWAQEVNTKLEAPFTAPDAVVTELIKRASELDISPMFWMVPDDALGTYRPEDRRDPSAIFPAIAIPTQTKTAFMCPEEHMNVLRDSLPAVTKLLVIGWGAMDRHFIELLKQLRNPQVMIVAEKDSVAQDVMRRLSEASVRGAFSFRTGGLYPLRDKP